MTDYKPLSDDSVAAIRGLVPSHVFTDEELGEFASRWSSWPQWVVVTQITALLATIRARDAELRELREWKAKAKDMVQRLLISMDNLDIPVTAMQLEELAALLGDE